MEAEVLGAWGDFIGGIAVVAGLVFVGIQLLGANKETRAATIQSSLHLQILVDTELANNSVTWQKVISNQPLEDEAEQRKAIILFNLAMTALENRYHQYQAGYLDENSWKASLIALEKTLLANISSQWRDSTGAATHSLDFLNLIDNIGKSKS